MRVHPAMVPLHHPLASVRESYNAVFVEGDAVGSLMFYGRGAGGLPTASAVLGDVIDAAVNLPKGTHGSLGTFGRAVIRPIDETTAEYLLSLEVVDRPACSHAVTGVFARHDVSIRPPSRRASATTRGSCSSPTRRGSRRCRRPCASCATSTSSRHVGGLLRVIGG